jgi:DNA-binding transcriptional LysR family regulator
MGDLLAAYRKGFPEVTVEMSFDDRFIDLVKEGYDVALRCTTGSPPSGLIARPLRSVPS